jgi:hypothetical protein
MKVCPPGRARAPRAKQVEVSTYIAEIAAELARLAEDADLPMLVA